MIIKMSISRAALLLFIFLMTVSFSKSQEIPADSSDSNSPIIENIDPEENLLDSNEVYKQQFDSLSKDGEWIEANKSDFLRDLSLETGEDLESNYPETNEIVYLWRPYCATANWNPYYNGNWVFSSFGWVWYSSYNWGWAPYNYGRWYCSNYYGWVWMPGRVWACNWVNWRQYNNYVCWYPTCPTVYWRHHNNLYCNKKFASHPDNWIVAKKKDFTKKIEENNIATTHQNSSILKNSVKVKSVIYDLDKDSPKFKYSGPEVADISKESGVKIIPEKTEVAGKQNNDYTKNINSKNSVKTETAEKKNDNNIYSKKKNYYNPNDKNPAKNEKKVNSSKKKSSSEKKYSGSNEKSNDGKKSEGTVKNSDSKKSSDGSKKNNNERSNGTVKTQKK